MLGPVVSRRRAAHGVERRADSVLSDCDRWHLAEIAEERQAQHQAWELIQRSHAVANGVYVAAANRVGTEGGLQFWGASFVSDPFGRLAACASHTEEETLVVSCDLTRLDTVRQNWPFLRDRRIDAYGNLTKRYLD